MNFTQSYELKAELSDFIPARVADESTTIPKHRVVTSIKLSLAKYLFVVKLWDKSLRQIADQTFDEPCMLRYDFELYEQGMLVKSGRSSRATGIQRQPNDKRIAGSLLPSTVINMLLNEAVATAALSGVTSFDIFDPEFRFLLQVANDTPYASGFNKTGPITGGRFRITVPTEITGLRGVRSFSTEWKDGAQQIIGIATTWVYQPVVGEPHISYIDKPRDGEKNVLLLRDFEVMAKMHATGDKIQEAIESASHLGE